jgi:hypothetical protein
LTALVVCAAVSEQREQGSIFSLIFAWRQKPGLVAVGRRRYHVPPAWLNSQNFVVGLTADWHDWVQWLFGRLNLNAVAADDLCHRLFLEKFVAWTGYQIDGSIRDVSLDDVKSREEISAILAQAKKILRAQLKDIDALRTLNAKKM